MHLTFSKEKSVYGSDTIVICNDYDNILFNRTRIINWNKLPRAGKCLVHVKSCNHTGSRRNFDKVINCHVCWCDNLIVHVGLIK